MKNYMFLYGIVLTLCTALSTDSQATSTSSKEPSRGEKIAKTISDVAKRRDSEANPVPMDPEDEVVNHIMKDADKIHAKITGKGKETKK
ncbi:MAG: hypothetical protein BGO76_00210 [Caedibacter sp. 38-128]|nr:MAG: hypothetical protein BGO76_00210 [Caedibacter sp. 38-128]